MHTHTTPQTHTTLHSTAALCATYAQESLGLAGELHAEGDEEEHEDRDEDDVEAIPLRPHEKVVERQRLRGARVL